MRLERLNGRQAIGCVLGDEADEGNHGKTAQRKPVIVNPVHIR